MRYAVAAVLLVLLACAGKDPSGVRPPPPAYHDPEIFFHFAWQRDSVPRSHPDTAIMRWYSGSSSKPDSARLLAQVEITGTDAICAYFLVADSAPLYYALGWMRNGVPNILATNGLYQPDSSLNAYDPFWDVGMLEDTLTGWAAERIESSRTTSFCPAGMKRDSIAAAP